ncbi:MAG TPA: hypothetical protein VF779_10665 [Pyrinomonadaceae bacterium]
MKTNEATREDTRAREMNVCPLYKIANERAFPFGWRDGATA